MSGRSAQLRSDTLRTDRSARQTDPFEAVTKVEKVVENMFLVALRRLHSFFNNRIQDDGGASIGEYAILLLLIAIACVSLIQTLGTIVSNMFTSATGMF